MSLGEVRGKCVDCYGCNRLQMPEFKGVYRCENYIKYIRIEEGKKIKDR